MEDEKSETQFGCHLPMIVEISIVRAVKSRAVKSCAALLKTIPYPPFSCWARHNKQSISSIGSAELLP